MGGVAAAAMLFCVLLLLEWLFWLSPLKPWFQRLMHKMGRWFYVVPFHYIARLVALAAVLFAGKPSLWPVFSTGTAWVYSASLGLVLMVGTYWLALKSGVAEHRTFWRNALAWYRESPADFTRHSVYLLVYPGFVEELIFRWFFTAALWPTLGRWTLVVSPALNIIWHLPVWIDLAGRQSASRQRFTAMMANLVGPATAFAVLLTATAASTRNLGGPVLVHAFADWGGEVQRRVLAKGGV